MRGTYLTLTALMLISLGLPCYGELAKAPEQVSDCGKYKLRVYRMLYSPQVPKQGITICMSFHCLDSKRPEKVLDSVPSDILLGYVKPLKKVEITEGIPCPLTSYSTHTGNFPPSVYIHETKGCSEASRLSLLELEIPVIHVKEWKTLKFTNLGKSMSEPMYCGPFALQTSGTDDAFYVVAGRHIKFKKEYENFNKRIPMTYLGHRYIGHTVQAVDSSGQRFERRGSTGSGGHTRVALCIPDQTKDHPFAGKKINYPISVSIRIPEKVVTEMLTFRFRDLPLPSLAEGKWDFRTNKVNKKANGDDN